ncbi:MULTISPECIES: hypothetical protein [Deefgea]|uniref:Uncharacterized protein n=1 Tax=Deefgea chitinilytica TaxID=570276 RepID=A0ABS2CB59_9NEIS|nr:MULTISPECIES: hypothetical protein [Deefgea]MBM5570606.1 hypothetical protein [Deefgea chitinilytica]MBM9887835.1 hypothetical protein [Deefgea sp. CFH1-16]
MSAAFAASIRGVRYLRLADTVGRYVVGAVPALIGKHTTPSSKEGAQLIGFYIKEGKRCNDNVRGVSCMVYDVDNKEEGRHFTIEAALELLDAADAEYTVHTTYNHSPELHKFRIILPFDSVITPEEYPQLWADVAQYFGFYADVDASCKDISRAYYLPSCPADMLQHARLIHCYGGEVNHGAS